MLLLLLSVLVVVVVAAQVSLRNEGVVRTYVRGAGAYDGGGRGGASDVRIVMLLL